MYVYYCVDGTVCSEVGKSGGPTSQERVDLAALGFHLDVLKIQNVSDERGYLEAIYMAIASMTNIPALLEKKNQQRKVDPEHVEH